MKLLAGALILLLIYLFYPFRDLYVKDDPFSASYDLVAKGFWSLEACAGAANAQQASDFQCRERRLGAQLFGDGYGQRRDRGE
ncbi:MAG: hypothetical protein WC247_01880 [Porticoccaceae bacterium]|jgi:hypothetical protein